MERRDEDYPTLFERCNFWAVVRDEHDELIGFGYVCGMRLEHGYMEDIIVHPSYRKKGIGGQIVEALLQEARVIGLEVVTVTYDPTHESFYRRSGFLPGGGGVWRASI
ncbi:GNAT family N-acetyltransferase [Geomicrobium sp. JCM 19039]|uniref:GNAT family N-acetyltransferase n=1 Tax=Geomicrobium sp. JCM 19039 TaxID=1460636 RepID=UPI00045F2DCA|nr:GNAT family N-acetyltransferase [Geomicrobium sp. JCM 19039]GAK14459.1 hypothetical protein JCM19039_4382 [Geomicrobium sp. JCM 19039]